MVVFGACGGIFLCICWLDCATLLLVHSTCQDVAMTLISRTVGQYSSSHAQDWLKHQKSTGTIQRSTLRCCSSSIAICIAAVQAPHVHRHESCLLHRIVRGWGHARQSPMQFNQLLPIEKQVNEEPRPTPTCFTVKGIRCVEHCQTERI